MLRALAPEIWVAEEPLRFFGLEIGARMTVVRLSGSALLLHSPISWSRPLAEQVEQLGAPAYLVAPNRFHHLYVGRWHSAYPDAALHVAPGLERKRPDLALAHVLGTAPPPGWRDGLEHVLVEGFPLANEVVFFHAPSRTLITSDLVFNLGAESPPRTRLAARVLGIYGRPSSTALERLFVRDRAAFRRSLERILRWPIERVVLAHGAVIESGGRAAIERAYAWLLR